MANENLGNVMTRLGGLKNVRPRRVMPGAEFLQELEEPESDVSGVASPLPNFANFATPPNEPEADLGGEITPQSYDVRANVANPPQEESGFFSRLGQALADYVSPTKRAEASQRNESLMKRAQTPPIATQQVDIQEGLPPETASQEEYTRAPPPEPSGGVFGAISDYFNPTKRSQMSQHNQELVTDAQLKAQGKEPAQVKSQVHEEFNQEVQKAMQNPWQYAAYGSASEVVNSPALQAQFKEITGIDYQPQIAAQIAQHEEAMKGVEDAYNGLTTQLSDQAEGIRQRIQNNQTNDADKYYIGLALLMPLLIGGFFGKEAALGALGGGAKGIADVLGGRQKSIREDEAALLDINKQQTGIQEKLGNFALEKAQLPAALQKNLPKNPNEHLIGLREIDWQDPDTGKQMKGVEVLPGFVARSEYVGSDDRIKNMQKAANELSEVKTYTDEINDLTDDVVEIVSQLDDPTWLWKGFTGVVSGKLPGALSRLSQDIQFDGRKVNAGTILEEKLGFLANAYGMAKELGQMDRAAQAHIKKIIDNPTSTLFKPEDTLNQILEIRKLAQRGLVRSAANKGFYPEFLIQDLESRNNQLFGGLNQKENEKRLAERKKQALQSETNYAQ